MRSIAFGWTGVAVALSLTLVASRPVDAQPPRSGGFDLTYGFANALGGEYLYRKGSLNAFELFFSTRIDGGNTPLLLGAMAAYFAGDDPTSADCVVSPTNGFCIRPFPDVAAAGFLLAIEPNIFSNTFLHGNAGLVFVQPSTEGGPTVGMVGAVRIGQSIGRHLALLAGGRIISVPNMRGEAINLTAFTVGIRIR